METDGIKQLLAIMDEAELTALRYDDGTAFVRRLACRDNGYIREVPFY